MSDFGSGLEQYGPMHELSGRASKADLRRRIAALEAEVAKSDQKCADLWADVSLYQNRLADVATEREQAEAELAEYKSAVKAHLASHHHGGYNSHTALTALAERITP